MNKQDFDTLFERVIRPMCLERTEDEQKERIKLYSVFLNGRKLADNVEERIAYYGEEHSCLLIGNMYSKNEFLDKDVEKAESFFRRTPLGTPNLAEMWMKTLDEDTQYQATYTKALELLKPAVKKGDAYCTFILGHYVLKHYLQTYLASKGLSNPYEFMYRAKYAFQFMNYAAQKLPIYNEVIQKIYGQTFEKPIFKSLMNTYSKVFDFTSIISEDELNETLQKYDAPIDWVAIIDKLDTFAILGFACSLQHLNGTVETVLCIKLLCYAANNGDPFCIQTLNRMNFQSNDISYCSPSKEEALTLIEEYNRVKNSRK